MAVLSFFKKALPFLTTGLSLAGPAGMAASTILGKVLNISSPTTNAIQDALGKLTLSPEIQAQLQEAENQYRLQMQSMGFQHEEELAALGAKDRDSARNMQMQTHSYTMPTLAFLSVIVMAFCIYMVGFRTLPPQGHDTVIFLLGIVAAMVKDVYGYFFGSSAGSDDKTNLLAAK
jgi:hypothetical protein